MGGACSTYGESGDVYIVLVGKPKGKRPLGRPRRKWEDNIKRVFQKFGCEGMHWIEVPQGRFMWQALVNELMNFWFLKMRGIA
jgi:hypothetical protein